MRSKSIKAEPGFTLLETLVTIIVLGVAGSALLGVYTNLVKRSADPIIQEQALAIAEAYMEEIRLKPFSDPPDSGGDGETDREFFDDVDDYDGLSDSVARNQKGDPIAGLGDYSVDVTVDDQDIAVGVTSYLITVAVDHPAIQPLVLKSYRVNY